MLVCSSDSSSVYQVLKCIYWLRVSCSVKQRFRIEISNSSLQERRKNVSHKNLKLLKKGGANLHKWNQRPYVKSSINVLPQEKNRINNVFLKSASTQSITAVWHPKSNEDRAAILLGNLRTKGRFQEIIHLLLLFDLWNKISILSAALGLYWYCSKWNHQRVMRRFHLLQPLILIRVSNQGHFSEPSRRNYSIRPYFNLEVVTICWTALIMQQLGLMYNRAVRYLISSMASWKRDCRYLFYS